MCAAHLIQCVLECVVYHGNIYIYTYICVEYIYMCAAHLIQCVLECALYV